MTRDELRVIGDAYRQRILEPDERWFAVKDDYIGPAHDLAALGSLERRWDSERNDSLFRLTDEAGSRSPSTTPRSRRRMMADARLEEMRAGPLAVSRRDHPRQLA